MDASTVRAVMALIPERVTRVQSGSAFAPADPTARYAERIARLARLLHWMSPLEALPREEQQALGLLNAAGRPVHAADLEDDVDAELEGIEAPVVEPGEPVAALDEPIEEDALA